MSKVIDFIRTLMTSLPFGMKGANDTIAGQDEQSRDGQEISQEISGQRIGKHLLKGEMTQDVADLRYRTYKVDNNAKNFEYMGNGVAVKKHKSHSSAASKKRIRFSQSNHVICESVLSTLEQVGKSGMDKYWIEIQYKEYPRFKIEKYAILVDVDIQKGLIMTRIHFSASPNPYDASSRPFINYIDKIASALNERTLSHDSLLSNIKALSFATYKASNEDDYVTYSFNDGKCTSVEKTKDEYIIAFQWKFYARVPLNLEEKFYSETMAKKYESNAPKVQPSEISPTQRKQYCSVCGQEMSVYDADIQRANGGKPICVNCLKKALINEQK